MQKIEIILAAVAVLVIAATLYFTSTPARSIAGNTLIPTASNFLLSLPKDSASATLHLRTEKPLEAGRSLDIDIRNNSLSERPAQTAARAAAGLDATVERNRAFVDTNPAASFPFGDFGTFAGVRTSGKASGSGTDAGNFLVGIRISPVRLLFGTVAPDLLAAPDDIGGGVSLYLPDTMGPALGHWGLGVGRLFSTRGGLGSSTLLYLSFSSYSF
jgi:hypothetical protein